MKRLSVLLTLGLVACDEVETQPQYLINEPRVLAIQADPPVVELDTSAGLTALVVDSNGDRIAPSLSWRACNPWQFVLDPAFDCAPEEALALDGATLLPREVIERFPPPSLPGPGESGVPVEQQGCAEAVPTLDLPVVLEVEVEGEKLTAIKRVPLPLSDLAAARSNPTLGELRVNGDDVPDEVVPGSEYELRAAPQPASLDLACDGDARVLESVRVHLYTTAGVLDDDVIDVEHDEAGTQYAESVTWRAPDEGGNAAIWLVAVDGEGGVDWRGYRLDSRFH